MSKFGIISEKFRKDFGLNYFPVGMLYSAIRPENALGFKSRGNGCIVPLIFAGARGKTVAFDKDTTGFECSAFFLGYKEWIFPGIECFLSDGIVFGRGGERFIRTKEQARAFVKSCVPEKINTKVTVFKPLQDFGDDEYPEMVIFFVTPDELSGLVYLLHFNSPAKDDLVVATMQSGCGSVVTLPMKYRAEGKIKAVMGMHDISARTRLPKEVLSLAMPFELVREMYDLMDSSFVITENWKKIRERNQAVQDGAVPCMPSFSKAR